MTTIGAALLGGAWLWEKFGEKVVEHFSRQGSDIVHEAWNKTSWKDAAENYRGEMQRLYSTMRIIGMAEPVALADIFTDAYLLDKPSAWRRYNIDELKHQVQSEGEQRREQRHDALDLIRRHECLMILGKPGAGKTTLMKHLVLQCTTGRFDAVPIFVGLKDWADSNLALMPFLQNQFTICAFPDAQPFIEQILKVGKALVLFDGLDEVNLEQGARERIIREVRDFSNKYSRSRYVITCRTAASNYQFEHFAYCELADFTENQMRTFATHWFQRNEAKLNTFLAEFAKTEHKRLRDLARTPLLLMLLCLTFDETMTFPPRRAEIYEEALDALLKKWDSSRSIRRDTVYQKLSLGHKRQMLTRIAAETFSKNELFIHEVDLANRIVEYIQRLPGSDSLAEIDGVAILRSIEAQHGLLVERAQYLYSFSHLTFHEYLTARYAVEHPSRQMFASIIDHAHDARWREILLLTASMLDDTNAEIFFDAFDIMLRDMIQNNPVLLPLFQWIGRKAENFANAHQGATRASYMILAFITSAVTKILEILVHDFNLTDDSNLALDRNHARIMARASDLALNLALSPVFDHDLSGARILANALAHNRDLAGDLASVPDLGGDFDLALASDRASMNERARARARARLSDHVCALARTLAHVLASDTSLSTIGMLQSECVWTGILLWVYLVANNDLDTSVISDYDAVLGIWDKQIAAAQPELRMALTKLTLPQRDAPVEDWRRFAAYLKTKLVAHLDIGHSWPLNQEQLDHLADYLTASTFMLECLDLAAVADRDAIRNRILLPPQP